MPATLRRIPANHYRHVGSFVNCALSVKRKSSFRHYRDEPRIFESGAKYPGESMTKSGPISKSELKHFEPIEPSEAMPLKMRNLLRPALRFRVPAADERERSA